MADRFAVLDGPGTGIERAGLARRCEEWGAELGVQVDVLHADTAAELVAALGAGDWRGVVLQAGDAGGSRVLAEAVADAVAPLAWADLESADRPPRAATPAGVVGVVRGRGIDTYRWSLRLLVQRLAWPSLRVSYGPGEEHVGDLRLPTGGSGPYPVAVMLHGGFWRERWLRDTIEPPAIDLARRGYATWNLEYRRVGPSGGGWPATACDVAAGIDHLVELAREHPLDLERVVLVGHSAGGQLALWATHRSGVEASPAALRPRLVVSLAGVLDLARCARRGVGDTANGVTGFLGCWPEERPEVYAAASPAAALPLGVHQLIAHGWRDPLTDLTDLGRGYAAAAAAAGDPVELVELEDDDHFSIMEPTSPGWRLLVSRIEALVPVGRTRSP